MIITCPNCQTRYQVAQNTIGALGRKVLCASCNQSWQAVAKDEVKRAVPKLVDDKLFNEKDEAALDKDFEKEEQTIKKEKESFEGKKSLKDKEITSENSDVKKRRAEDKERKEDEISDFAKSKRQKAMKSRHNKKAKTFPLSKIRNNAQYFAIISLLILIISGFTFSTQIVRYVPQMAVLYEFIGIEVNIFGLEFKDVKTISSRQNAQDKMLITAKISNITKKQVNMPIVIVSILDGEGNNLLQWGATPIVQVIEPGETIDFETQLSIAPLDAKKVSLAFAEEWKN